MKKKYVLLFLIFNVCIVSPMNKPNFNNSKSRLNISKKLCNEFQAKNNERIIKHQEKSELDVEELLELYHKFNPDNKGNSILPNEIKEHIWNFINGPHQLSRPSIQKVMTDVNAILLAEAAKKILEQPEPNTKQYDQVINTLKSNPQKYLIIYTAQEIYEENIFKKLYDSQAVTGWKSCLIS